MSRITLPNVPSRPDTCERLPLWMRLWRAWVRYRQAQPRVRVVPFMGPDSLGPRLAGERRIFLHGRVVVIQPPARATD